MSKAQWVVAGGAVGEAGHCERCGEGLKIGTQRLEVAIAAMKAFARCHARCQKGRYTELAPTLAEWPTSRDTGISSATIYQVFTGHTVYREAGTPRDLADFGRCYRLLRLAPEWEHHLSEVVRAFPEWFPFIREWPRLGEMYRDALKTNDGKEMYDFMQTLRAEGQCDCGLGSALSPVPPAPAETEAQA